MKKYIVILLFSLALCSKKSNVTKCVVYNERYYLEEMKKYAHNCNFDIDCMNKKVFSGIPSSYFAQIHRIKNGWVFTCIDRTRYGSEEEIREAKRIAQNTEKRDNENLY